MSGGVWIASYVVLWAAVAVLLVVVLALVRQIGVLHVRLDEAGASSSSNASDEPSSPEGPPLGALAPMPGRIGYQRAPLTLVAFTSETCELSQVLAPALKVVDKQYSDVRVLELPLGPRTIAAFEAFNVLHTPFVVAVDQDGRVRGRGRSRNLEQLEAFVARALALATRAAGGAAGAGGGTGGGAGGGAAPRKPDAPDGGGSVADVRADAPEAKAEVGAEAAAAAAAAPETEARARASAKGRAGAGAEGKAGAEGRTEAPPVAEAEAGAPPAGEQPADNIVLLDVAADPARASV